MMRDGNAARGRPLRRRWSGAALIGASVIATGAAVGGTLVTAYAHTIVSTTPIPTSGPVGTALKDSAKLVNTTTDRIVKFELWAPGSNCTGSAVFTEQDHPTAAQGNGSQALVTTGSFAASQTGTYEWTAKILHGTSVESSSSCGQEPVTITKATPAIVTVPVPASGVVGASIGDSARVTGGYQPGGTVSFSLYGPTDQTCAGTDLVAGNSSFVNRPISGGNASTGAPGYTTTAVGTYHWLSTYNGDSANNVVKSPCSAESVSIRTATPAITTTASSGGAVGGQVSDTALVSGGNAPTGTVSFALYGVTDSGCSGTPVFTSAGRTLSGGNASSAAYVTNAVGTYHWIATYSGDSRNASVTSVCADEAVIVTATGTPTSTPSPTATPTGGAGAVVSIPVTNGGTPISAPATGAFGEGGVVTGLLLLTAGGLLLGLRRRFLRQR